MVESEGRCGECDARKTRLDLELADPRAVAQVGSGARRGAPVARGLDPRRARWPGGLVRLSDRPAAIHRNVANRQVNMRFAELDRARLDRLARARGLSRSELVRQLRGLLRPPPQKSLQ